MGIVLDIYGNMFWIFMEINNQNAMQEEMCFLFSTVLKYDYEKDIT